jgi:hypothetical protein
VTRPVFLDLAYLGQWETPFWVGDENRGTMRRVGFEATTRINRHDFGVSLQDELPGGGLVVSNEIPVIVDVEAILEEDLERTGAIEHYRERSRPWREKRPLVARHQIRSYLVVQNYDLAF